MVNWGAGARDRRGFGMGCRVVVAEWHEDVPEGGIVPRQQQDLQRHGDGFDVGHDLSPG